jgi:hypothetical protein
MNQTEKAKDVKIGDKFSHFYGNGEPSGIVREVIQITDKTILFKAVSKLGTEFTNRESRNTVESYILRGYYRKIY